MQFTQPPNISCALYCAFQNKNKLGRARQCRDKNMVPLKVAKLAAFNRSPQHTRYSAIPRGAIPFDGDDPHSVMIHGIEITQLDRTGNCRPI